MASAAAMAAAMAAATAAAMAAATAAATAAAMAAKAAKATTVKNNCNNEYSDVSPCFCSYALNPCIPIQCYGCILFLQIMSGSKVLLLA